MTRPLLLSHPSGASAELHLNGGHLTSWRPADTSEALFVSRAAVFRPGTAIRGGIPVIFPQFAGLGPLPKHGFARTQPWNHADEGPPGSRATLELRDTTDSRSLWPHAFVARLRIELGERSLAVRLRISNPDSRPFSFTCALHTYLRVADARAASLVGLEGVVYRSALERVDGLPDPEPELRFAGEVDRVYLDAPGELLLHDPAGGRTFRVVSTGFRDAVVWNPGAERAAALPDMRPGEHREMVCVEAAQVGEPVRLAPGEEWTGEQRLEV